MKFLIVSAPLLIGTPGVSPEAVRIEQLEEDHRDHIAKSSAFGHQQALSSLASTAQECSNANWDGYGADPVSPSSVSTAKRLISSMPLGTPSPTIGAEPDGSVTLEWFRSPVWLLSVSVGSDGLLHYAALFGSTRSFGTEPFYGELSRTLLDLIKKAHQA